MPFYSFKLVALIFFLLNYQLYSFQQKYLRTIWYVVMRCVKAWICEVVWLFRHTLPFRISSGLKFILMFAFSFCLFYALKIFPDTIVCATPGLEALCQLIGSAALYSSGAVLLNSLKNDVYTVFAPNNNALENILSTVDISDIDTVVSILLYHAIPDIQISSNDVVEFCGSEVIMANGEAVTVDCRNDNIFVLGSGNKELRPKIVKTDIATCTGIIHIVNQVILSL